MTAHCKIYGKDYGPHPAVHEHNPERKPLPAVAGATSLVDVAKENARLRARIVELEAEKCALAAELARRRNEHVLEDR
jgi:hypothetical protein